MYVILAFTTNMMKMLNLIINQIKWLKKDSFINPGSNYSEHYCESFTIDGINVVSTKALWAFKCLVSNGGEDCEVLHQSTQL